MKLIILVLVLVASVYSIPTPTPELLYWSKQEIGAMITFGMATSTPNCTHNGYCIGVGGCLGWLPPVDVFNPMNLNVEQWIQAGLAFNAKYAVLVTQHCAGFSLFPSSEFIYKETGFNYTYSVEYSKWGGGKRDVVKEFISACQKYGMKPAFYYSLNENYYLNVGRGKVQNSTLVPGQVEVSQDLYDKIAIAQMEYLWSNYGDIFELWFDGGDWPELCEMATRLQPHAVYFNGICNKNNIRWIGTESGLPKYPVWSTNDVAGNSGQGDPNGQFWNPAETDTTPTPDDNWFWHPSNGRRTLAEMIQVYHQSVGQNSNLLLNIAPDNTGLVPSGDIALYQQFGAWQKTCYGKPLAHTNGVGKKIVLNLPENTVFNRISISENQELGQRVRSFDIRASLNGTRLASGTSIGNKYIAVLSANVQANRITLEISAAADIPHISQFAVYLCSE